MTAKRHIEKWLAIWLAVSLIGPAACKPPQLDEYLSEERVVSDDESESEAIVIALVEGEAVTLADVQRNISSMSEAGQWLLDSSRVRQDFAQALVQRRMLASRALAEGFSNDPTVEFLAARASAEETLLRLTEAEFPAERPTDEEVAAYYEAHPTWYQRDYEARFAIAVADQATANTVLNRANSAAMPLPVGERQAAFAEIAVSEGADYHGEEDSLYGFVDRDTIIASFGEEAGESVFETGSLGSFFGPYEVAGGWAVLLVTRIHFPIETQLFQVEPDIRRRIAQQRLDVSTDSVMQRLRDNASIELEDGVYETLGALRRSPDVPEPSWRGLDRDELEVILNYHPIPSAVIERYQVRSVDEGTGQGTSE